MIIRKKTNTLALLFAWRGTIFPKVLPAMLLLSSVSLLLGSAVKANLGCSTAETTGNLHISMCRLLFHYPKAACTFYAETPSCAYGIKPLSPNSHVPNCSANTENAPPCAVTAGAGRTPP